jgi:hypothetical protein
LRRVGQERGIPSSRRIIDTSFIRIHVDRRSGQRLIRRHGDAHDHSRHAPRYARSLCETNLPDGVVPEDTSCCSESRRTVSADLCGMTTVLEATCALSDCSSLQDYRALRRRTFLCTPESRGYSKSQPVHEAEAACATRSSYGDTTDLGFKAATCLSRIHWLAMSPTQRRGPVSVMCAGPCRSCGSLDRTPA